MPVKNEKFSEANRLFSEIIRISGIRREDGGYTEIAKRMGIPRQNVYRYMSGERTPTVAVIERLAEACRVNLLLTGWRNADDLRAIIDELSQQLDWLERES